MVQVQLILAGSQAERLDRALKMIHQALGLSPEEKSHPDLLVLEPGLSLGIGQIRSLQKKLALKPYSAPMKAALITQAEKLTVPAQNALLKTLEEPPANTLIILLSPSKEALLPTILSRCQMIQLTQKSQLAIDQASVSQSLDLLISVLKGGIGERLELAQAFSQRQKALSLTESLLFLWREWLLVETGAKTSSLASKVKGLHLSQVKKAIELTEQTRQMIEANVNPRLGIENLFLHYPVMGKKR